MTPIDWIVHPNRSDTGSDEPGQNGHYRSVSRPRSRVLVSKCFAQVTLPRTLAGVADSDGTITFGGQDWWFVVGAARTFAKTHVDSDVLPPFGFKRGGQWLWWDNTTSDESILDGPDGSEYVREYLGRLFPSFAITVSDAR
jgi:hypothetical protein